MLCFVTALAPSVNKNYNQWTIKDPTMKTPKDVENLGTQPCSKKADETTNLSSHLLSMLIGSTISVPAGS